MLNEIQEIMTSKIVSNVDAGLLFCKNDEYSTILYANDYFFSMVGYTREEVEELFENRFAEMVVDDVSEILKDVDATIKQGKNLDFEYRMRRKDGSIIWIHDTAAYNKETNTFYVVLMDITEKKTIQYQMEKLSAILKHIPNKILIADLNKKIEYTNMASKKNPYLENCNIEEMDLEEIIGKFIIGQSFNKLWSQALKKEIVSYETRVKSKDKIIAHDKNYLVPILDQSEEIMNVMQVSEDLMKQNDALTGTPNRGMFEHYYKKRKESSTDQFCMALCIIDIDNFKNINDSYGHAAGDFVIQTVAKYIIDLLEEGDYVSRYGGDEFILLIKNEDPNRLDFCLQRLMQFKKEEIIWNGNAFHITYSLGVAETNGEHMEYSMLFQNADIALYEAKYKGKNTYVIYEDRMMMSRLSKRYYGKYIQRYLKENHNFYFVPYENNGTHKNIRKVDYNLAQIPQELRKFLKENRTEFEWYMTEEIFETVYQKIINKFIELKREEKDVKICIIFPIELVLESQFFIVLDKVMSEYQELKEDILFKVVEEKQLFQKEIIEKFYYQFVTKGYELILGNFGKEVTSYEILIEFPTNYLSVETHFMEKCQSDKKYKIVWNMVEQFVKCEEAELLVNECSIEI